MANKYKQDKKNTPNPEEVGKKKRQCTHPRRKARAEKAVALQNKRSKRTDSEQIKLLDIKFGKGQGAKKERERLALKESRTIDKYPSSDTKRYHVMNETDGIPAAPDVFDSLTAAQTWCDNFRKLYEAQGYYLTSECRRIRPSEILLSIKPC